MKKVWLIAVVPGVLAAAAAAVVIALFAVKWLWSWTIPDILPGAVAQGLVAREISWLSAFKLSLFIGVLAAIARGAVNTNASKH